MTCMGEDIIDSVCMRRIDLNQSHMHKNDIIEQRPLTSKCESILTKHTCGSITVHLWPATTTTEVNTECIDTNKPNIHIHYRALVGKDHIDRSQKRIQHQDSLCWKGRCCRCRYRKSCADRR